MTDVPDIPEACAPAERKPQRFRHPSYALVFAALIGQIQEIGYQHGYAIAAHGTMATDLDLIAAPWTEAATDGETLVRAVCTYLRLMYQEAWQGNPEYKPHGRVGYVLHFDKSSPYSVGGPYIDFQIMPRLLPDAQNAETASA